MFYVLLGKFDYIYGYFGGYYVIYCFYAPWLYIINTFKIGGVIGSRLRLISETGTKSGEPEYTKVAN